MEYHANKHEDMVAFVRDQLDTMANMARDLASQGQGNWDTPTGKMLKERLDTYIHISQRAADCTAEGWARMYTDLATVCLGYAQSIKKHAASLKGQEAVEYKISLDIAIQLMSVMTALVVFSGNGKYRLALVDNEPEKE